MCTFLFSQHALLESEAENVRTSIKSAVQHIRSFAEEVNDSARRLGAVIQQIEGGVQMLESSEGETTTQQVRDYYQVTDDSNLACEIIL